MKRIIPVLLLILFLYSSAFAQDEEYWSFGVKKHTPEEQEEYDRYWNKVNGIEENTVYPNLYLQKKCTIEGSIETIVQSLNGIAQLLNEVGYMFIPLIDSKNCSFEITNNQKGFYTCPINSSTGMLVFTDKHLNAEMLQIFGPAENDKPKKTTYDWAYAASILACMDWKTPEIDDMFLSAWRTGYYTNDDIEIFCGIDPYLKDTWTFIIANK